MIPNHQIKSLAKQAGFSDCGITSPVKLSPNRSALEKWTASGFHGDMKFLENNNHIREDIRFLFPATQSVIVCLLNYKQEKPEIRETAVGKISHYALGTDYHIVMKRKLNDLLGKIQVIAPETNGICYTDSAPIFEREYARLAGLGWLGKNTLLLNRENGSYFFIGILLVDQPIEVNEPFITNHCGSCTACIDFCPTNAIESPGFLNAAKCISYLTIEQKTESLADNLTTDGWIWGCDICQDVCPWNKRFSKLHNTVEFAADKKLLNLDLGKLKTMSENGFRREFALSPIIRRGKKGLLRNIGWLDKT